jgi:hypothetical protein
MDVVTVHSNLLAFVCGNVLLDKNVAFKFRKDIRIWLLQCFYDGEKEASTILFITRRSSTVLVALLYTVHRSNSPFISCRYHLYFAIEFTYVYGQ